MNLKHVIFLMLLLLMVSCVYESVESKSQNERHKNNSIDFSDFSDVIQDDENSVGVHSKEQFDTTLLIGTWVIHDSDFWVLEYPYVDDMPDSFNIFSLDQIHVGAINAKYKNYSYPFMLNKIDPDSLMLYLHPDACKCEGLEARYRKV